MTQAPVVVTGGTGFVGRRLVRALIERGEHPVVLSRRAADPRVPAGATCVAWTPEAAGPWGASIDGARAVVHLAGEPVVGRWTAEKKEKIRASRVRSTTEVVAAIRRAKVPPSVLVCASAVGFYGHRDASDEIDESALPGHDFLAGVVQDWESAAEEATALGVRVVRLRIGIVLGDEGGALSQMLTPFRMFAGGPLGNGRQVLSWIHADDVVGLVLLSLDDERARGAMNATAPAPVDMNELSRALGRRLSRPSVFRVPEFALRGLFGEGADPLLTGQRALPRAAERLGYQFRWMSLDAALADLIAK
jgi:hypothetical protein